MMRDADDPRLKRLKIRSWRRGTKEMDMILIRYSDARLDALGADELDQYDALLSENDQDLYQWVSGQKTPPEPLQDLISDISSVAFQQ